MFDASSAHGAEPERWARHHVIVNIAKAVRIRISPHDTFDDGDGRTVAARCSVPLLVDATCRFPGHAAVCDALDPRQVPELSGR